MTETVWFLVIPMKLSITINSSGLHLPSLPHQKVYRMPLCWLSLQKDQGCMGTRLNKPRVNTVDQFLGYLKLQLPGTQFQD